MARKTLGSDSRLSGISSTNAQKRKVFGVSQSRLEEILTTTRRFMKEYLDIKLLTSNQEDQAIKIESAVKEEYPDIFEKDESTFKMRHLRHYIFNNHSTARSAYYRKLDGEGEKEEVVVRRMRRRTEVGRFGGDEDDSATVGSIAGPSRVGKHLRQGSPGETRDTSTQSGGSKASLPSDFIKDSGGYTTHPRPKRGRLPVKNRHSSPRDSASAPIASASTARRTDTRVEVVIQSRRVARPITHVPPPNPQDHVEPTPRSQDSDTGLKEVEQFLRDCQPSLINLLDHLAYYGCVNGDFLEILAGRAERLEEEEFHKYLRNHFSKGHPGRKDLTEMEVLVLTEGLLRLRGG